MPLLDKNRSLLDNMSDVAEKHKGINDTIRELLQELWKLQDLD